MGPMSQQRVATYGPSALATPANLVTVLRLLLAPVIVVVVLSSPAGWLALVLWAGVALSDKVDGVLARRQGTTRAGAFLDPLADKVLVFSVLGALWLEHRVPALPVVIMGARELAVSIYRTQVLAGGHNLPARLPGKLKMLLQVIAVGAALVPGLALRDPRLIDLVLWGATALAILSAVQYFVDGQSIQP
jgi:CDP-diacylglycerol--glycerol-3-phosphate 3-phosphatidyltransferase